MLLARKLYLPAFVFFAAAAAAVGLALLQETDLARIAPFLAPKSAYGACLAVFTAYLAFAWPFSASYSFRRMLRTPFGQARFAAASLGPPAALFMLMLPLLAVAGFYSDRGIAHAAGICPAFGAFALAVLALLRLGFYFEIRTGRIYLALAFAGCAGIPALDFVLRTTLGRGAGPFAVLNPFGLLAAMIANPDPSGAPELWLFTAAWSGAALILASLPAALGKPPRGAWDVLKYTQNETEEVA